MKGVLMSQSNNVADFLLNISSFKYTGLLQSDSRHTEGLDMFCRVKETYDEEILEWVIELSLPQESSAQGHRSFSMSKDIEKND
jgi:hypothetical protein